MKRLFRMNGRMPALAAMLVLVAACQPGASTAPDRAADEAAIRAVLDAIAADFSAGRMEQMFAHYLDDVLVSAPGAPDIASKAAWRDALAASLPPGLQMSLRFDTDEMAIDGDLAYERGTYSLKMADPDEAGPALQLGGRHIHIFRRQPDGAWKGWRLMENSADPATAPQPTVAAPQ